MSAKQIFKSIITLSFVFVFFGFCSSLAHAELSVSAVPPKLELKANPGQTLNATLKVVNNSPAYSLFKVAVDDFIVVDSIGTPIPVVTNANNRWSLKSWITSPSSIPVDGNSSQVINITIRVPQTALPGGHYAMLTYQPNADIKAGDMKKTSSIIGQRVGTLIYVTVSGAITENANLSNFTTSNFHEKGPVEFVGNITNLSDIHVNPKGSLTIYSPFNTQVAVLPVEVGNVFPEITRQFKVQWDQKWGYGKYKAVLNLAYGTAGTLTSTIFFWLFPITMVIYTLILIISILIIIILINKKSKRHQQILEQEVAQLKKELEETHGLKP